MVFLSSDGDVEFAKEEQNPDAKGAKRPQTPRIRDDPGILKPALARGAIRVIGATTIREYRQTIEKDGALERLTKVVHFKPLEMVTAREILGKLVGEFNQRLADRGVTVGLDESAEELILREGFSEEYGARNLERVMDRMLGTLIAEALLCREIATGQQIRILANEDRVQICSD